MTQDERGPGLQAEQWDWQLNGRGWQQNSLAAPGSPVHTLSLQCPESQLVGLVG